MMHDYDFMPALKGKSTTFHKSSAEPSSLEPSRGEGKSLNTSSKSASTSMQPSMRVVQNILNFARCSQNINVKEVKIKLYLN